MGEKRKNSSYHDKGKKKYRVSTGLIEPSTSGIYATCNRRQEKKCQNELRLLFEEKLQEYYEEELKANPEVEEDSDKEEEEQEEVELSIEESIKKELEDLQSSATNSSQKKSSQSKSKSHLQFIDLGCECVVFCKTRRPIDPEVFVERICQDSYDSKIKTTRYTQKLTPITFSVSASIDELVKLAKRVLKPHFHKEEGQLPHTFAIKITSRNFSTLSKNEMISKIAECIGRDHGHKVDLKNYEKLILVECFKNNIGMSVVNNYEKYSKFNLQQIFTKQLQDDADASQSRVRGAMNNTSDQKPVEPRTDETTPETSTLE